MVEELKTNNANENKGFIDYSEIEDLLPMMTCENVNKVEEITEKNSHEKNIIICFILFYIHDFIEFEYIIKFTSMIIIFYSFSTINDMGLFFS